MIGLMPVKLDYALPQKFALLETLYRVLEEEASRYPFVCEAGCADCCTVNLLATGAEARYFLDSLERPAREALWEKLLPYKGKRRLRPRVTPNEMAALLMSGKEPPADEGFVFEPCPFLKDNLCSIYERRAFICRTFFSLKKCHETKEAEAPPEFLSLSTVLTQLIEEIDLAGLYGNFLDLLLFFMERERASSPEEVIIPDELLSNREAPDFAIPPQHERYIRQFLARLYREPVGDKTFKELLDEVKEGAQVKEALSFLGEAL
ncbi:MAG: YkgJ family cysteine cluster protein [Thermodesulfobacteria bacterium]|nr:YkgJ family cysteine cluster protein [Thermodesulfobacteriota bacterium]